MSVLSDLFNFDGNIVQKLFHAVETNNLSALKALLAQHGAELNKPSREGFTLLMQAIRFGQTDIANYLITCGADIHKMNQQTGDTALMLATRFNRTSTIKLLLGRNASVDVANHRGETALIDAVNHGDANTVAALLEKTKNIDQPNAGGDSALSIAARRGLPKIVSLLVEKGANMDHKNNTGRTPVEIAEANGCLAVTKIFQNIIADRARLALEENIRQQHEAALARQDELKKLSQKRHRPPNAGAPQPPL
jgi:ankyrin repeat protein